MFEDLSPERRREIRGIMSEDEYKKLTPHEMAYYRLTEPMISRKHCCGYLSPEDPLPSVDTIISEFNKKHGKLDD